MSKIRTIKRTKAIRAATPDVLAELFEMQNRICDLCGQPIQDLVLAVLEHSIPVIRFARGPLPIEEAVRQCNAPGNLRAAHSFCNHTKKSKSREEWFALGLDKTVGTHRILTTDELLELQFRINAGPRASGRKSAENGWMATLGRSGIGGRIGGLTGGHTQGRKNKENSTGIFAPEHRGKGGRVTKEKGLGIFAPGMSAKGGRKSAATHRKNGTGIFSMTSEQRQSVGRKSASDGHMVKAGRISAHNRWHVARDISNPNCTLCQVLKNRY